ncbi:hypothetical protein QZH41_002476 [Actinostola sp. cb2023]|nr:hypothetical protein QZH41_002476 [Actinostola sp. cb2023]
MSAGNKEQMYSQNSGEVIMQETVLRSRRKVVRLESMGRLFRLLWWWYSITIKNMYQSCTSQWWKRLRTSQIRNKAVWGKRMSSRRKVVGLEVMGRLFRLLWWWYSITIKNMYQSCTRQWWKRLRTSQIRNKAVWGKPMSSRRKVVRLESMGRLFRLLWWWYSITIKNMYQSCTSQWWKRLRTSQIRNKAVWRKRMSSRRKVVELEVMGRLFRLLWWWYSITIKNMYQSCTRQWWKRLRTSQIRNKAVWGKPMSSRRKVVRLESMGRLFRLLWWWYSITIKNMYQSCTRQWWKRLRTSQIRNKAVWGKPMSSRRKVVGLEVMGRLFRLLWWWYSITIKNMYQSCTRQWWKRLRTSQIRNKASTESGPPGINGALVPPLVVVVLNHDQEHVPILHQPMVEKTADQPNQKQGNVAQTHVQSTESGPPGINGALVPPLVVVVLNHDQEHVPILHQPMVEKTADQPNQKQGSVAQTHVQSTESGRTGSHGALVPPLVVVVLNHDQEYVPILHQPMVEKTADQPNQKQGSVAQAHVQSMESGRTGTHGALVPPLVVVVLNHDQEHVPILHPPMVEKTADQPNQKQGNVAQTHVQSTESGPPGSHGAFVPPLVVVVLNHDQEHVPILHQPMVEKAADQPNQKQGSVAQTHVQSTESGRTGSHGALVPPLVVVVLNHDQEHSTESGPPGINGALVPLLVVVVLNHDQEHVPILHQPMVEKTADQPNQKQGSVAQTHVQSTESGPPGSHGAFVPPLVVVVLNHDQEHVPILHQPMVEKTADQPNQKQGSVEQTRVQSTENGRTGSHGAFVPPLVVEVLNHDQEHVPILHQPMVEKAADQPNQKQGSVVQTHVQSTESGRTGSHGALVLPLVVVAINHEQERVPILHQPMVEKTADQLNQKQGSVEQTHVQLMESGPIGILGETVLSRVVVVANHGQERVQNHHQQMVGRTVREIVQRHKLVRQIRVQIWDDWQKKSNAHMTAFFKDLKATLPSANLLPIHVLDNTKLLGNVRVEYAPVKNSQIANVLSRLR